MTTATTEGRRLMLNVEGIDAPFAVDPLPAKRGKYLTEQFLIAVAGKLPESVAEQIFIESIGVANYSRISGFYLELVEPLTVAQDGTVTSVGETVATASPEGVTIDNASIASYLARGFRWATRDAREGEDALAGEPIRQEEAEALCLCAFYWQTVAGMESVNAFLDNGEGSVGSLKALALLLNRSGISQSTNSSTEDSESGTAEGSSSRTPDMGNSSALGRLPANRRSIRQNLRKKFRPGESPI